MSQLYKLWGTPVLIAKWGEQEERTASWLELFYDLVYVTAAMSLAEIVEKDPGLEEFAYFLLMCTVFAQTWQGANEYFTRFSGISVISHLVFALHLISVMGIAVNAKAGFEDAAYVGIAAGISRLSLMLVLLMPISLPQARRFIIVQLTGLSVSVILFFCTMIVDRSTGYVLMTIAQLWEITHHVPLMMLVGTFIPVNVLHMQDRFSDITMVALGESLISIIRNQPHHASLLSMFQYYLIMGFCVLIPFMIALSYFSTVPTEAVWHAVRRSMLSGLTWSFFHSLLFSAILLLGVGISFVMEAAVQLHGNSALSEESTKEEIFQPQANTVNERSSPESEIAYDLIHVLTLCGSVSMCLLLVIGIRVTHWWGRESFEGDPHITLKKAWWFAIFVIALLPWFGLFLPFDPLAVSGYLFIVTLLSTLVESCISHKIIKDYETGRFGLVGMFPPTEEQVAQFHINSASEQRGTHWAPSIEANQHSEPRSNMGLTYGSLSVSNSLDAP
eukprot:CFRG7200T1